MGNKILELALDVKGLTVCYDRHIVLWNLSFQIPQGKLVAVVGPNGAGKSTLLKACFNLTPRLSGVVRLLGKDLRKVRKQLSYVPQRESVDWDFPITVEELVMMGRYAHMGWFAQASKEDKAAVDQALEQVGLKGFRKRQISQLSGGQQQRSFLARSLAQDAKCYFLDEPFSAVDVATERDLSQVMKRMANQGKSLFVVHHDLSTIEEYFDWVILINKELIAAGPVEEVFKSDILEKAYGRHVIGC